MDARRYAKIIYLLGRKNLLLRDVAREAGCSASNITQWARGEHNSIDVARALARLTGCIAEVAKITGYPLSELNN